MCVTCEAMEQLAKQGHIICDWCGSRYDRECDRGHAYCSCAQPMVPYGGGNATPCFRCAADL